MPLTEEHGTSLIRTAVLALIAIAGLLVMHGFEGASLTLTDTGHMSGAAEGKAAAHGAIGICVFVISVAGFGIAAARANGTRPRFVAAMRSTMAPAHWPARSRQAGRSLLIDLRVLRL